MITLHLVYIYFVVLMLATIWFITSFITVRMAKKQG
jgi:hypothetical protein